MAHSLVGWVVWIRRGWNYCGQGFGLQVVAALIWAYLETLSVRFGRKRSDHPPFSLRPFLWGWRRDWGMRNFQ